MTVAVQNPPGRAINNSNPPLTHRFVFIDGLRGIAAMIVMFFHFFAASDFQAALNLLIPLFVFRVLKQGYLGVEIFFVLSGFVMAHSQRNARMNLRYLGNFALRRSLRLDPAYWLSLFLVLFISLYHAHILRDPAFHVPSARDMLASVFYLQLFLKTGGVNDVAWTLCYEVQFYLVLTLLTALAQQAARRWPVQNHSHDDCISPSPGTPGEGRGGGHFRSVNVTDFDRLPPPQPSPGVPGEGESANNSASRRRPTTRPLWGWRDPWMLVIFSPLAIATLFPVRLHLNAPGLFVEYWYMFFLGVLAQWVYDKKISSRWFIAYAALVAICLLGGGGPPRIAALLTATLIFTVASLHRLDSLLAWRSLQFLGRISYSIYLLHSVLIVPILQTGRWLTGPSAASTIAWTCFAVPATLLAATLMYYFVEKPGIDLGRRLRFK